MIEQSVMGLWETSYLRFSAYEVEAKATSLPDKCKRATSKFKRHMGRAAGFQWVENTVL